MPKKRWSKVIGLIICILCMLMILCSCYSTPEEQAITGKDNEALEELLRESAAQPKQSAPLESETPMWELTKEFGSGSKLIVMAPVITHGETNAPVAVVKENPFAEEQCKQITEDIYPDSKVRYYAITKAALEPEIMKYKQYLHLLKSNPEKFYENTENVGFAFTEEMLKNANKTWETIGNLSAEEQLNIIIDGLEQQYREAPDDSELQETDYKFQEIMDEANSEQMNLMVYEDKGIVYLSFVNWKTDISGSELKLSTTKNNSMQDIIQNECVQPDAFKDDAKFYENKKIADDLLDILGIDYMDLQWVTSGKDEMDEDFYTMCYTRVVNGFSETHTPDYLGTLAFDPEFEKYRNLWKDENLQVTVKNGEIISARWLNPAKIEIENENVKIISWEEVQEIFLKQMDRLMAPDISKDDFQVGILGDNREIHINKIELGLTKILIANSDEYKLIPTWTFSGYDKARLFHNPETAGAITCFVTINAVDGSIIDRGLMY
ncbi:MAG: DUF6034 family protein [Christensenella sp.]